MINYLARANAACRDKAKERNRRALSRRSSKSEGGLPRRSREAAKAGDLKRHRPKGLPRRSRQAKAGWTPERRARQAAAIRTWQPWRHTTGPRTDAGKARCVMNALRHGFRSREHIEVTRLARHVLRVA